jgi:hypothetical protein
MTERLGREGGQRTGTEGESDQIVERLFDESPDSTRVKLMDIGKWARRQDITSFLARYEIFKRALRVKGSIVECGVFRGGGVMTWAKLSAVLEPNNLTRRIYGFDTFEGFRSVSDKDQTRNGGAEEGEFDVLTAHSELQELIRAYDMDRFLGHVDKVHLIKGDAVETVPIFLEENPHLLVSLLFLDFDLYEPTKVALEHFLPRMPRGAIVAFDELDNPSWPGETLAMLDSVGSFRLERLEFDPYKAYAVLE